MVHWFSHKFLSVLGVGVVFYCTNKSLLVSFSALLRFYVSDSP